MPAELHAVVGASNAHRWMHCPPSARWEEELREKYGEVETAFSAEGHQAHLLAELQLRTKFSLYTKEYPGPLECSTAIYKMNPTQEMRDYVEMFLNYVERVYWDLKAIHRNVTILVEQRLDFSCVVPEGFGTGDVVIVADDELHIIDLKYGKGVKVSPLNNPQLRLYGLGAYQELSVLYDIERVFTHIFQPRIDDLPDSPEELTVEALMRWAYEEVAGVAKLAFEGKGQFCAGEHCQFCKGKNLCRHNAAHNLRTVELDGTEPAELREDELSGLLSKLDQFMRWAKSVKEYAATMAVRDHRILPGWKLVAGRSIRTVTNPESAIATLQGAGYGPEKTCKLRGIGDLEKLLGKKKFATLLADFVVKPPGKPVLAPETDPRSALSVDEVTYFGTEDDEEDSE